MAGITRKVRLLAVSTVRLASGIALSPARTPEMAHASISTRRTRTPSRLESSRSSASARITVPVRVTRSSQVAAIVTTTASEEHQHLRHRHAHPGDDEPEVVAGEAERAGLVVPVPVAQPEDHQGRPQGGRGADDRVLVGHRPADQTSPQHGQDRRREESEGQGREERHPVDLVELPADEHGERAVCPLGEVQGAGRTIEQDESDAGQGVDRAHGQAGDDEGQHSASRVVGGGGPGLRPGPPRGVSCRSARPGCACSKATMSERPGSLVSKQSFACSNSPSAPSFTLSSWWLALLWPSGPAKYHGWHSMSVSKPLISWMAALTVSREIFAGSSSSRVSTRTRAAR